MLNLSISCAEILKIVICSGIPHILFGITNRSSLLMVSLQRSLHQRLVLGGVQSQKAPAGWQKVKAKELGSSCTTHY